MRFYKTPHKNGDIKIVKRFLWLPMSIGNETRWLETAVYEKKYLQGSRFKYSCWYLNRFIN